MHNRSLYLSHWMVRVLLLPYLEYHRLVVFLLAGATVYDAGQSFDKYEIGDLSNKFGSMSGTSLYKIQVKKMIS